MSWLDRYRFKLYIRHSIWIFPALSIVVGLIAVILLHRIERTMGWELTVSQETARLVMSSVATSMFTLVVVGSSAVLLVVQLASATPDELHCGLWIPDQSGAFSPFRRSHRKNCQAKLSAPVSWPGRQRSDPESLPFKTQESSSCVGNADRSSKPRTQPCHTQRS